ncbi:hypothetical protein ABZX30_32325 [Streptomyces sp. NPDC004542]|uniref:hypothetical protein n=1 Tax=Streptomyces sp. NPDC004542 TaxID=3154281 RepID=UPI0033AFD65C
MTTGTATPDTASRPGRNSPRDALFAAGTTSGPAPGPTTPVHAKREGSEAYAAAVRDRFPGHTDVAPAGTDRPAATSSRTPAGTPASTSPALPEPSRTDVFLSPELDPAADLFHTVNRQLKRIRQDLTADRRTVEEAHRRLVRAGSVFPGMSSVQLAARIADDIASDGREPARLRGGMLAARGRKGAGPRGSSQQGSAGAGRSRATVLHGPSGERAVADFTRSPKGFLRDNVVLLRMDEGMRARMPGSAIDWPRFLRWMDGKDRHWFTLTVDPARSTADGRPVYLLTPAVEKYVEAFAREDGLLRDIVGRHDIPGVRGPGEYVSAYYVPYHQGATTHALTNVGHTDVPVQDNGEFAADFVFTAAMNGCALVLTPSAREGSFTVWHYQSPSGTVNAKAAEQFRGALRPYEWFGHEQYMTAGPQDTTASAPGLPEATNLLWRGPNGWEILSQDNLTPLSSDGDVTLRAFRSREVVAGRGWFDIVTIHREQARERLDKLAAVRSAAETLPKDANNLLLIGAHEMAEKQAAAEASALDKVAGPDELLSVARRLQVSRRSTNEYVRGFLDQQDRRERERSTADHKAEKKGVAAIRRRVRGAVTDILEDEWPDRLAREVEGLPPAMTGHPEDGTSPLDEVFTPPPAAVQLLNSAGPASPDTSAPRPHFRTTFSLGDDARTQVSGGWTFRAEHLPPVTPAHGTGTTSSAAGVPWTDDLVPLNPWSTKGKWAASADPGDHPPGPDRLSRPGRPSGIGRAPSVPRPVTADPDTTVADTSLLLAGVDPARRRQVLELVQVYDHYPPDLTPDSPLHTQLRRDVAAVAAAMAEGGYEAARSVARELGKRRGVEPWAGPLGAGRARPDGVEETDDTLGASTSSSQPPTGTAGAFAERAPERSSSPERGVRSARGVSRAAVGEQAADAAHTAIEMDRVRSGPQHNNSPFLVPEALGDVVVSGAQRFPEDHARAWAHRIMQTTDLPVDELPGGLDEAAQRAMRDDIERRLAGFLASPTLPAATTAGGREERDRQREGELLGWEAKLESGQAFVSQGRLVWLLPVLRDVRPLPEGGDRHSVVDDEAEEDVNAGAEGYRVAFGSTTGKGSFTSGRKREGAAQLVSVVSHHLSRMAASVIAAPQVSASGDTATEDNWTKLNIAGSKPFVRERGARRADLAFRIFVDGREARYLADPDTRAPQVHSTAPPPLTGRDIAALKEADQPGTVVPRRLTVEYPRQFLGDDALQPLDAAETAGSRPADAGGGTSPSSRIPVLLNAVNVVDAVADLHRALRRAGIDAEIVVDMLKEVKEQITERGLRNRSRLMLGGGDVSGPVVVRDGTTSAETFSGHLRFQMVPVPDSVVVRGVAPGATTRTDIGSGLTLTHTKKFESTVTLSASYNASGLRTKPSEHRKNDTASPGRVNIVTGTLPMLSGGIEAKRGGSTGLGAQTLNHTVLNASDDQVRATARVRMDIEVVSHTGPRVEPVSTVLTAEVSAPHRDGRGARFLQREWAVPPRLVSSPRPPAWVTAQQEARPAPAIAPADDFDMTWSATAGADTRFTVATAMPGSHRVQETFRAILQRRIPGLTPTERLRIPLNRTAVDNELASFFGRHALETDIAEAQHGIVHTIWLAGRQFRLTARLHVADAPFDTVPYRSTVNQRQMTMTQSSGAVADSGGFDVGFGGGFRLDLNSTEGHAEFNGDGGRIQFVLGPEYGRDWGTGDSFQTASSSYRRSEVTRTVQEGAFAAAWHLSVDELAAEGPPQDVWLSGPDMSVQVIDRAATQEPRRPESAVVTRARQQGLVRRLRLESGGATGMYAQFTQFPHLTRAVSELYARLHGVEPQDMPPAELPEALTRELSPRAFAAHFQETASDHARVVGLPRRGEWNQAMYIRLTFLERVADRRITADPTEFEQYQSSRSTHTSTVTAGSKTSGVASLAAQYRREFAHAGATVPEATSTSVHTTGGAPETATEGAPAAPTGDDHSRRRAVDAGPGDLSDDGLVVPGAYPADRRADAPALARRGPSVVNPGNQEEHASTRENEVFRASGTVSGGVSASRGTKNVDATGDIHVTRVTYVDSVTDENGERADVFPTVMSGDVGIMVTIKRWRDGGGLAGLLPGSGRNDTVQSRSLSATYVASGTLLVPDRIRERMDDDLPRQLAADALTRARFARNADRLAATAPALAASARAFHAAAERRADADRPLLGLLLRLGGTRPPTAADLTSLHRPAEELAAFADDAVRAAEAVDADCTALSRRAAALAGSGRAAAGILGLLPGLRARHAQPEAQALHADVTDAADRAETFSDTAARLATASDLLLSTTRLVRHRAAQVAGLLRDAAAPGTAPRATAGEADDARRAAALLRAGQDLADALGRMHDAARALRDQTADAADDALRLPGDSVEFPPRARRIPRVYSDKARLDRAYHIMVPTTAMHPEHLAASDVFESIVVRLVRSGHLQRDQDDNVVPDALYRSLRSNFASSALRDQFHAVMGTGVTGWYALPRGGGALGARYLRVHVSASRFSDALWNRLRPEVKIMYRSESSRQWKDAVERALRQHMSLSAKANGGTKGIHGGVSVDGSVDREGETSRGEQNKDIHIFRADLKGAVQEFVHHVDFDVRIDAYATLPAFAQAPRDMAAALWDRAVSWLPEHGLLGAAVETARRRTAPWAPLERVKSLWDRYTPGGALHHDRFVVPDQFVQVLVPESFTTPRDSATAMPHWTRALQPPDTLAWAPPRAAPPAASVEEATQDMYSWGGQALYAVQTWAKVAALDPVDEPPLETEDDVEKLLSAGRLQPGSLAETVYEAAVGYNTLRPRLKELLRGTYVVDVGGVPVRVRLVLTGYQEHTPSAANMKVRTYNPTTTAPENENSRRFAWGAGVGADIVDAPRDGLHEILNLSGQGESSAEYKNAYEIGDTDESNRLVDKVPYTAFIFDTLLQLEPVHHPRRALHVHVFGGLLASIPHRSDLELASRLTDLTSGGTQPAALFRPEPKDVAEPGGDTAPPPASPEPSPGRPGTPVADPAVRERSALREAWGAELAGRSFDRDKAVERGARTGSALEAWELWEAASGEFAASGLITPMGPLDRATREMVAWGMAPGPRQRRRRDDFQRAWRQQRDESAAAGGPAARAGLHPEQATHGSGTTGATPAVEPPPAAPREAGQQPPSPATGDAGARTRDQDRPPGVTEAAARDRRAAHHAVPAVEPLREAAAGHVPPDTVWRQPTSDPGAFAPAGEDVFGGTAFTALPVGSRARRPRDGAGLPAEDAEARTSAPASHGP